MTVPVAYLTLRESAAPIAEPVTKFGGQPVWIDGARWPLSATDGTPMRFVAQVALDPRLFGGVTGTARMAYVFLAVDDPQIWTDGEYARADGALVLQPGPADFPHAPLERGPQLYRLVERRSGFLGLRRRTEEVPCEYAVALDYGTEPTLAALEDPTPEEEAAFERAAKGRFAGTKLGGTPAFIQVEEYPFEPPCRLVIQISDRAPEFELPLGDVGSLYAFVDARGERTGLVIQQH